MNRLNLRKIVNSPKITKWSNIIYAHKSTLLYIPHKFPSKTGRPVSVNTLYEILHTSLRSRTVQATNIELKALATEGREPCNKKGGQTV